MYGEPELYLGRVNIDNKLLKRVPPSYIYSTIQGFSQYTRFV